mgnify:CR=1 FL=1
MITQTYNLNLIPSYTIPPIVHVSQYDDSARTIAFNLFNGSQAFNAQSGTTALVQGVKPDKQVFSNSATISGSTVSFSLTSEMTSVDGSAECEIRITDSTGTLGTANFILEVEKSIPADEPTPTDLSGIVSTSAHSVLGNNSLAIAVMPTVVTEQIPGH